MSDITNADELLTVQAAAAFLGVRDSSVRSALLQKRLTFILTDGRKMVKVKDVEEYRHRTQPDGVVRIGQRRKVKI